MVNLTKRDKHSVAEFRTGLAKEITSLCSQYSSVLFHVYSFLADFGAHLPFILLSLFLPTFALVSRLCSLIH